LPWSGLRSKTSCFESFAAKDGGESQRVEVTPGQVEWEEASARVHRAVNVGKQLYEQVTLFMLDSSGATY
jgi:hypothetical protein